MEVIRDAFNPVSYPEVEILRHIHGDDAVLDVKPIAEVEQSVKEEKERLQLKYGGSVVEDVFPGKNPRIEMDAPKVVIDPNQVWKNPLDKEIAGYDVDPTEKKEKQSGEQTKTKAKTEAPSRVLKDNPFAE